MYAHYISVITEREEWLDSKPLIEIQCNYTVFFFFPENKMHPGEHDEVI